MSLVLQPPIAPALARGKPELPTGERWLYEPKYDGFRALVFMDGDELFLQSRGLKPLRRYFPELAFPSGHYVLDGEIVIDAEDGHEDFGALQNRLHPAESRVRLLAEQTPARFIAFDLLEVDGEDLMGLPFSERRSRLEAMVAAWGSQPSGGVPGPADAAGPDGPRLHSVSLTPLTTDPADCEPWLATGEGVVAKLAAAVYAPGKRTAMVKVKRIRTIDCVVVGYRTGKEPGTVGSLILGLYEEDGTLRPIGHSSGIKPADKKGLLEKLSAYESGQSGSGDPSRWATERDLEWVGLRPELIVEIRYDHVSGGRIRHGTKILAWREDKAPGECLLSQMD